MAKDTKPKIEMVKTADLIPYARNSRTHSDEQVAQIAASIREFGFTNPVLIDGQDTIIAGHGRIMAAQKLKLSHVPCIRLSHLTEAQKRAYVIADNKLALIAGWNDEMLRLEIDELKSLDFDVGLLGFSDDELKKYIGFDVEPLDEMPSLASGDRTTFRSMSFTFDESQKEDVERAIEVAKKMGAFEGTLNENVNGNSIARICSIFLGQHG